MSIRRPVPMKDMIAINCLRVRRATTEQDDIESMMLEKDVG